jgi:xylitol oxidase
LQSEYILPRQYVFAAFRVVNAMREYVAPLLQISEIRTIAADHLWMSPCYQQDCVAIHFTWKKDWDGVKQVLPILEDRLAQFDARPHWGKLFTMSRDRLQSLFPRLPQFRQLLQDYDPHGKFRNAFLDKYIF